MINFLNQQVAERYIAKAESDVTIVGLGSPTKLSKITLQQADQMLACADPNIQLKPTPKPTKKVVPILEPTLQPSEEVS